ncbi:hypothetical protein [Nocardia blacklockiae]|uniref:hypothetical protein n=1 Tax=Nocardia blacklockiae TaxID=480036 RepID=UPI0018933AAF|nr:hypothetical protein [Nocardia blacklockiae]MBF6169861.1 hypothetical protein [Nocardia blacklockiae]
MKPLLPAAGGRYSWEIVGSGRDGERPVDSGHGELGTPDPVTGRTCETYVEVGTAVFDQIADEIVAEHRYEVLEARLEGRPDPDPPLDRIRLLVCDHEGVEKLSATAALSCPAITGDDVESYRREQALIEKREARRRERRDRAIAAGTAAPPGAPADPRLRGLINTLRVEAATVREEVPDADHCREQLFLAQATVRAATEAEERARYGGTPAELEHARAYIARWTPRIERWAAILELTTEAYADADAVDDLADRISLQPPVDP